MRHTKLLVASLLVTTVACTGGGGSTSAAPGGSSATGSSGAPSGDDLPDAASPPPSSGDGPRVLSLTADRTSISPGETITFAAILAKANDQRIAGGTLKGKNGAVYGAFQAASENSTFTIALSWDQIDGTESITFTGSTATRELVAVFFDDGGGETTTPASITLACGSGKSACSGKCVDPKTDDDNCGVCGNTCASTQACVSGSCASPSLQTCVDMSTPGSATTCKAHCASLGGRCMEQACSLPGRTAKTAGFSMSSAGKCTAGETESIGGTLYCDNEYTIWSYPWVACCCAL
jgi:hypothetical protein